MTDSANDWDDAYPTDVDRRMAVVVAWPHGVDPYAIPLDQVETEFTVHMRRFVEESLRGHLDEDLIAKMAMHHYQIGPTAQWSLTYLLTFLPDVETTIDYGAKLLTYGRAAIALFRGIGKWRDDAAKRLPPNPYQGPSEHDLPLILSEPLIRALCFAHFAENYQPKRENVSIDSSYRTSNPIYGTAGHPGGYETYTMRIWTGRTSYVYVVGSQGRPIDHFSIQGGTMRQLPLPSWIETERFEDEPTPRVRSTVLDHRAIE